MNVKLKSGLDLIAEERQRQMKKKGYSPAHDDKHTGGELALAASVYADFAGSQTWGAIPSENVEAYLSGPGPLLWPWEEASLKLSEDPLRNLAKAGALIAAEIDRRLRLGKEGQ